MPWRDNFDLSEAYWQDYREFISALPAGLFPDPDSLNQLLPEGLKTASGQAVSFVNSATLNDEDYEQRIYNKGIVSTRPDSWHDLFNALVWSRFPQIKIAINTLHNRTKPVPGRRGQLRDALTLFDECGVMLVSSNMEFLTSVANRDWQQAFQSHEPIWQQDARLVICGHAMLEKLLTPYKSMTAKALLIHTSPQELRLTDNELLDKLDRKVARAMLADNILKSPRQLSPLPLAGVPGWCFAGEQNSDFYADEKVFRPAPAKLEPAPALRLGV